MIKQIYGGNFKGTDIISVATLIDYNIAYTNVTNGSEVISIDLHSPTREDVFRGEFSKQLIEHVNEINDALKKFGAKEELNIVEFTSQIIHQIWNGAYHTY